PLHAYASGSRIPQVEIHVSHITTFTSPAPRSADRSTSDTANGTWKNPATISTFGTSSRCVGCDVSTPTTVRGAKMNTAPIAPMIADATPVHASVERHAIRGLPAPRYCPASAAAAVPI